MPACTFCLFLPLRCRTSRKRRDKIIKTYLLVGTPREVRSKQLHEYDCEPELVDVLAELAHQVPHQAPILASSVEYRKSDYTPMRCASALILNALIRKKTQLQNGKRQTVTEVERNISMIVCCKVVQ